MKIALTAVPEIPVPPTLYGGIERIVDILVRRLHEQGHDVTLFAHPDSVVPCKLVKWKGIKSRGILNPSINTASLLFHVQKERYDVIHSFGRLAYLLPILPLGLTKIMSYQREPTTTQIKKALWLAKKNTLFFTGCSNYISDQIKPFAKAQTVYNCVALENYEFVANVKENAPLIFLGRIEFIKGTHIAIEVAQKTNRRLIIAGNIPSEAEIYFEKQIKPFLNEFIQYVGPVNDEQKNILLGQAAAFLMPIQWNEPFGIVMIEAMACGTPVIGFPFGAVPEVVKDGINGFLCKHTEEMVHKVTQLDTISRHKVRAEVESRFTDSVIVKQYLNLYGSFKNQFLQLK